MCGIAGILFADPARPVAPGILKAMSDALAHRGPDAEGFWSAPGIGLAHRRLSIIDLTSGDQPISNEDGTLQVIFNGEIYNYQDLRTALQARGHRLATQSDTEVLTHLYEDHDEDLLARLRGMFAFALWDGRRRRLLLARDRVGIKPLYIYRDAEKLLFASELKAILAFPGISRELDLEALESYLAFGMVPSPRCIFRKIEKLPPAHFLLADADNLQREPRRYWQLHIEPDFNLTADQWQEAIRAKVDEVVRLHLIADVPVGAFLSGGLDSSLLVASAAGLGQEPLQTFSIGFSDECFSELPYAREVARRYRTRHTEEIVTPDAVRLLDELVYYYDEPFADSSAIPTFLVSRLARRHVKVVLSGDGGDEAFGGYARYAHDLKEAALRRWLPSVVRRTLLAPLARAWPKTDWLPRRLRAKTLLTNLSLEADAAYANTLSICRQPLRRQLLASDVLASLNGHDPERSLRIPYGSAPAGDALGGMIATDTATILPDDFLVKVDRASMAHGLEVRPPLLDHELLEMAARIPSQWKVHKGETKWIAKRAFADRLPQSSVWRPKHGFEMPVDAWLRGPLHEVLEASVLDRRARVSSLLNQATVHKLYRAHRAGIGQHGGVLWSLLILARWAERYLGDKCSVGLSTPFVSASGQPA